MFLIPIVKKRFTNWLCWKVCPI